MNLEELANLGEAISGFAVIFSLLYLAYEVRRNTQFQRATSASESQDSLAIINELIASDEPLAELFSRVVASGSLEALTPQESIRFMALACANMQRFESMYFKYEAGILEPRIWSLRRNWMAGFLKQPGIAEWWVGERESSLFSQEFIQDIESVDGINMAPSTQRQLY